MSRPTFNFSPKLAPTGLTDVDLVNAHTHCINHREDLFRSERCGCFNCLAIFPASAIESWTDEVASVNVTAFCPFGREGNDEIETDRPWLRVDIALRASAPYGKPLPMPAKPAWARWVREAMGRLERIEPIVPEDNVREADDGRLEILAWRGEPEIKAICAVDGELKLESVELSAWQAIELPRQWDDSDREPDEDPHRQLREMFARVKTALHAWMEVMDHLL